MPPMQQEPTQQLNPLIDLQILVTEESLSPTRVLDDSQLQPSLYPLDGIEGEFAIQDADTWLDNMFSSNNSEWIHNTAEAVPSPPTSMVTDTHTALGKIYRGCKCPSHQEIYSDWPTHDAELTITQCMKTCIYCGSDFSIAAELRKHLKRMKYARRNLHIYLETQGTNSSTTPAWTSRHQTETPIYQSDSEPLVRLSDARTTQSQSYTNSANTVSYP